MKKNSDDRFFRAMVALLALVMLAACEAPLELSSVKEAQQEPIKRIHDYQAAAHNGSVAVIVGNFGVILASSDNGKSWVLQEMTDAGSFLDVAVCPDNTFIALNFENQIWHGSADAADWNPHPIPTQEPVQALACPPDGTWWVVGGFTTILWSNDQGKTWGEQSFSEDALLTNIQFIDERNAVISGEYGIIAVTSNGGMNWDILTPVPDDFYIHTSHFESLEQGWVGGLNGFIFSTQDGGDTWVVEPTETEAPIFNFIITPAGILALADYNTVLQRVQGRWRKLVTAEVPVYLRAGLSLDNGSVLTAGGRGFVEVMNLPREGGR